MNNLQNQLNNAFKQALGISNNPNTIMQTLLQQNPQLQIILNQMQQSNLTPQQYVMQMAKQQNLPLNQNVVNTLFQNMRGMIPR